MRYTYYICPDCHRPTGTMKPLRERYAPTAQQLEARPDMEHIGSELLQCRCGRRLSWFEVQPVTSEIAE